MTDRVTLGTEVYMPLDGQWQVVRRGTVFDTADGTRFSAPAAGHTVSFGSGGSLTNNGHTSVLKPKESK